MIGDKANVGRKERLVALVNLNRGVRPPKKRICKICPVIDPDFEFNSRILRTETHAMHSLHSRHRFVLAAPNRFGTVVMLLDFKIDRHEGGRAMMLGPVKFDSAGNPASRQADESRFDNLLAID